MIVDMNAYMNDLADEYSNSTEKKREEKIVPKLFEAFGEDARGDFVDKTKIKGECNCDYCRRIDETVEALKLATEPGYLREHSGEYEPDMREMMLQDLDESYDEVFDTLALLGEGTTNRDVLSAILGMEATISLIKRFLLDREE